MAGLIDDLFGARVELPDGGHLDMLAPPVAEELPDDPPPPKKADDAD